jgi:hypothetical protein
MASMTPAGTPAHETLTGEALLAVELELMRTPALARLNGARRRDISRGILESLNALGLLAGTTAPEQTAQLRAA